MLTEEEQATLGKDMNALFEKYSSEVEVYMKARWPQLLVVHMGVVVVPIDKTCQVSEDLPVNVISTVARDTVALRHMGVAMLTSAEMMDEEASRATQH